MRSYGPAIQATGLSAHLTADHSDGTANQTANESHRTAFAPANDSSQPIHTIAHASLSSTNCSSYRNSNQAADAGALGTTKRQPHKPSDGSTHEAAHGASNTATNFSSKQTAN